MTTTNVETIRAAIETRIAALTPQSSVVLGKSAYTVASKAHDWDNRPGSDVDREFSVEEMDPGNSDYWGAYTENPIRASMTVRVGHRMGADLAASGTRRDRDLEQIVRAVCWGPGYTGGAYPTGVVLIRYIGLGGRSERSAGEIDGSWISNLRFEVVYLGPASGE